MRRFNCVIAVVVIALIFGSSMSQAQEADNDGDGIGDSAEVLLGTNPQNADTDGDELDDLVDSAPTMVEHAPQPSAGSQSFAITEVLVENNYNPTTGNDAPDHLEISLENLSQKSIGNLMVFYTVKDLKTAVEQSYFLPLEAFTLPAGEVKPIHIDITGEPGHYSANPNGLYYTSQNELQVTVTVLAEGYQAATLAVKKDAGGAEEAD